MMIGGCGDRVGQDQGSLPVSPQLVYREELPVGDAVNARLTRATNAVRDQLEPQWGRLDGRVYLLPRSAAADFLRQTPPTGWTVVAAPHRLASGAGWLISYARGRQFMAYLLLDGTEGEYLPVQLLHSPSPASS
ncbi:hypothetical protein MOK15_21505 [Sphingobium sp. BYY-5]|uniref:hypothetical protein n=1 Tax=Sphingobium sp. BYY-5 TaxID=2926400 RepID=UPI001FA71295|nr:hypothetical protein [Sphingobium sp. BYY-5]MCI4592637.1 hypothetical protein [Sphingobium sp. BYY-5]